VSQLQTEQVMMSQIRLHNRIFRLIISFCSFCTQKWWKI